MSGSGYILGVAVINISAPQCFAVCPEDVLDIGKYTTVPVFLFWFRRMFSLAMFATLVDVYYQFFSATMFLGMMTRFAWSNVRDGAVCIQLCDLMSITLS